MKKSFKMLVADAANSFQCVEAIKGIDKELKSVTKALNRMWNTRHDAVFRNQDLRTIYERLPLIAAAYQYGLKECSTKEITERGTTVDLNDFNYFYNDMLYTMDKSRDNWYCQMLDDDYAILTDVHKMVTTDVTDLGLIARLVERGPHIAAVMHRGIVIAKKN